MFGAWDERWGRRDCIGGYGHLLSGSCIREQTLNVDPSNLLLAEFEPL